jgi:hypothetical protein
MCLGDGGFPVLGQEQKGLRGQQISSCKARMGRKLWDCQGHEEQTLDVEAFGSFVRNKEGDEEQKV